MESAGSKKDIVNHKNGIRYYAPERDFEIWLALKRFRDPTFVTDRLRILHDIPRRQIPNAKKQAAQIAFCIQQAEEYWISAKHATIATSPLLLYYSIMSMAIVEILWKHSGNSSLDRARSEHGHHGLEISLNDTSSEGDLLKNACIKQASNKNGLWGTFELWRQTARQMPIPASITWHLANNDVRTGERIFLNYSDFSGQVTFPPNGVNLHECVGMLPGIANTTVDLGYDKKLVRCSIDLQHFATNFLSIQKGLHMRFNIGDCPLSMRDFLLENIMLNPNFTANVEVDVDQRPNNGAVVTITPDFDGQLPQGQWPDGFPYKRGEVMMPCAPLHLNEFGYMYSALYTYGMISRYYPDKWMHALSKYSPSALIAEALVQHAAWRAPMLLLGELQGVVPLVDD